MAGLCSRTEAKVLDKMQRFVTGQQHISGSLFSSCRWDLPAHSVARGKSTSHWSAASSSPLLGNHSFRSDHIFFSSTNHVSECPLHRAPCLWCPLLKQNSKLFQINMCNAYRKKLGPESRPAKSTSQPFCLFLMALSLSERGQRARVRG